MMPSESSKPFKLFNEAEAMAALKKAKIKELQKLRKSDKGKKLVDWVKNSHAKAKNDRTPEERKWAINLAAYGGRTDLFIHNDPRYPSAFGRIGRLPENGRSKIRVNRIRPVIRTEIARLLSQEPSAYVLPASSDDDDLFAAQAGEQAWKAIKDRGRLDQKFATTAFWVTIAGTGFIKSCWDPKLFDAESEQVGDISFAAPSPFHIFVPDRLENDIEDQSFVLHAYAKPLEWVKMTYRDELAGEKLVPSHSRGSQLVENSVMGVVAGENSDQDSVIVYEAWVKPGGNSFMPEGGVITVVNDILVQFMEPYPYQHGEFPFAKFEHLPTETFYADSIITDVLELQREYNSIRSRINETINKMSSHQLMAPKGSISASKITNEIGQVILYNPGLGKPEPLPIQQVPGYVSETLNRIIMDMEDLSGQHQVSKGSAPPGVTAATAISYLQEKDDSYMVHTYKSIERGFRKLGHQSLTYAVQYWDIPRLVKTIGEDLGFDAQMLVGSQLRSGTDLRIEAGSALPESKSAKQALLMDMMSQGFIDPNKGLEMMEIGGSSRIIDQMKIDERQAQRENMKMKSITEEIIQEFEQNFMSMQEQEMQFLQSQEMPPEKMQTVDTSGAPLSPPPVIPVNTWDNHIVHIEVHDRFRKSQQFELLSDAVKQQIERHVEMHKDAMVSQQIDQFMASMPGDGEDAGSTASNQFDMPSPDDAGIAAAESGMMPPEGGDPNAAPGPSPEQA